MKQLFLLPGQLVACPEPTLVSTVLGSCVAIALFDPITRIGGLNHFLIAEAPPQDTQSPRYGSFAIPELIRLIVRIGARRDTLKAKVYGGANVLDGVDIGAGIGVGNVRIALRLLEEARIPVIERNTGGQVGRKILLDSGTFEVRHEFNERRSAA